MNKIKKCKELVITAMIAIVLTLLILSIKTDAVIGDTNLKIDEIFDIEGTPDLAWFIANHRDKHMAYTADEIFELNKGGGFPVTNDCVDGYVDIQYNTCACWYHDEGNQKADGYKVRISNIIDITTPGTMTIYKYIGNKKEVKYQQKTVEYTGEDGQKIAAFAYLAYYAGEFGKYNRDGRWIKRSGKRDELSLDVGK